MCVQWRAQQKLADSLGEDYAMLRRCVAAAAVYIYIRSILYIYIYSCVPDCESHPWRSHTLQAIHLVVFVRKSLLGVITGSVPRATGLCALTWAPPPPPPPILSPPDVQSEAIPCGIRNTLGNKGAAAVPRAPVRGVSGVGRCAACPRAPAPPDLSF